MAYEPIFLGDNIAIVHGVTDDSADTGLSTLPPNPWESTEVRALAFGEGVYGEDTDADDPHQTGVTASTIDVRSTIASKNFVCVCVKLGSCEGLVLDHSGTTT